MMAHSGGHHAENSTARALTVAIGENSGAVIGHITQHHQSGLQIAQ